MLDWMEEVGAAGRALPLHMHFLMLEFQGGAWSHRVAIITC